MSEPSEDLTTGERIKFYRERRGMSRPVLAGLVGRGPERLKKVERNERPVRANTDFHAVSVGVDLRTPGTVLNRAEEIDLAAIPSVERRSRVLVALARGRTRERLPCGRAV